MDEAWGLRVLRGLLACSSAPWRARFEDQAKADLEDAWNDLPADRRAAWVALMGWDLLKGAVKSNLQRQPQAVLATAGGGGPISPKEVIRFMAVRLPQCLGVLTVALGGTFFLGLGAYDIAQFKVAGLLGLALMVVSLPRLERVFTHATSSSKNSIEQVGHNLIMAVAAGFVCTVYFLVFGWVEDQALAASRLGMTASFAAVIPMPVSALLVMVVMAPGCTVLGLFTHGQAPRNASLMWFGVTLGLLWFVLQEHNGIDDLNSYGWGLVAGTLGFLFIATLRRLGQHPLLRWPLLFLGTASLPMLLGFLVALNLDASNSTLERTASGQTATWSLLDMAREHSHSLNEVRSGRQPPETFWATTAQLQARQNEWARYKPVMRLVTPQPAGIRARDWCMAQHTMEADFGASQCATLPDPDRWLTENPAP